MEEMKGRGSYVPDVIMALNFLVELVVPGITEFCLTDSTIFHQYYLLSITGAALILGFILIFVFGDDALRIGVSVITFLIVCGVLFATFYRKFTVHKVFIVGDVTVADMRGFIEKTDPYGMVLFFNDGADLSDDVKTILNDAIKISEEDVKEFNKRFGESKIEIKKEGDIHVIQFENLNALKEARLAKSGFFAPNVIPRGVFKVVFSDSSAKFDKGAAPEAGFKVEEKPAKEETDEEKAKKKKEEEEAKKKKQQ